MRRAYVPHVVLNRDAGDVATGKSFGLELSTWLVSRYSRYRVTLRPRRRRSSASWYSARALLAALLEVPRESVDQEVLQSLEVLSCASVKVSVAGVGHVVEREHGQRDGAVGVAEVVATDRELAALFARALEVQRGKVLDLLGVVETFGQLAKVGSAGVVVVDVGSGRVCSSGL